MAREKFEGINKLSSKYLADILKDRYEKEEKERKEKESNK